MDEKKIIRRERRLYRKYVDGKIVYGDRPNTDGSTIPLSSSTLSKKSTSRATITEKDKNTVIINKILGTMTDIIKPDVNVIADNIYTQLKESNIDVEKNTVKNAVKESIHYRATKDSYAANNEIDQDKLRDLVSDVYSQVATENQRAEIKAKEEKEKTNPKVTAASLVASKKEADAKKETDSKKEVSTDTKTEKVGQKKPTDTKPIVAPKKDKKKMEELDFGDDDLDLSDDSEDDDDLGMKF